MPWRVVEAAIAHLRRSPVRPRRLVLTGGEPLLEYALVARAVRHAAAGGRRGGRVLVSLLTNGTRLDARRASFLAANGVDMRLSFDGVPAAQAARGAWTFARLDALLDSLRRDHPHWFTRHVGVSATVTAANVAHLADSVDYFLAKDVRSILLAPAMGPAGRWRAGDTAELAAQFARIVDKSAAHLRTTGRVPLDLFRGPGPRYGPSVPMCGAASGSKAAIDTDGGIYCCTPAVPMVGDGAPPLLREASRALRIGNAADRGVADALPAYREALASTGLFGPRNGLRSAVGPCRACRWRASCTVCPMTLAHAPEGGDPACVPDNVCAFNRVALASRARFVRHARAAAAVRAVARKDGHYA